MSNLRFVPDPLYGGERVLILKHHVEVREGNICMALSKDFDTVTQAEEKSKELRAVIRKDLNIAIVSKEVNL